MADGERRRLQRPAQRAGGCARVDAHLLDIATVARDSAADARGHRRTTLPGCVDAGVEVVADGHAPECVGARHRRTKQRGWSVVQRGDDVVGEVVGRTFRRIVGVADEQCARRSVAATLPRWSWSADAAVHAAVPFVARATTVVPAPGTGAIPQTCHSRSLSRVTARRRPPGPRRGRDPCLGGSVARYRCGRQGACGAAAGA